MTQLTHSDVTIIGAGLTGLSLAHFLKKHGKTVRLVEKEDRFGGSIRTLSQQGFTFETGPNTGVVSNMAVDELFRDLEGQCQVEGARPESKARWIWKNDRWHALPSGPVSAIGTPLFTPSDKFRILLEPFRSKGNDPMETVAGMVKRRLGQSFLDYAVDPFISGVYAGDPNYLVTRFALPKLYRLEQNYGSFIGGSLKRGKELKAERANRKYNGIFSFIGGMESLTRALSGNLGKDEYLLTCRTTVVLPDARHYQLTVSSGNATHTWKSRHVICTTGSTSLKELLPFVDSSLIQPVQEIKHAKVIQAAVGFTHWQGIPIAAYGGLIPSREKRKALGILFPSSLFTNRSPHQGALVSVFLGGFRHPEVLELTNNELEMLVQRELQETLQTGSNTPDLISIHKHYQAIPQYGADSAQRLHAISTLERRHPGLYLAGNIRDGIGMADRIQQAHQLAKQIAGKLVD